MQKFIEKLPNKYTIIGENGIRLSGEKSKDFHCQSNTKKSP